MDNAAKSLGASAPAAATLGAGWIAALAGLVAANVFLRHTLEESDRYIRPFLSVFYPDAVNKLFAPDYPVWRLFLPMPDLTGSWTTTTLIVTHVVETRIGAPQTWVLFNAILVVASFALAWMTFRSAVLAFTFAICLGFGTQLYHTYAVYGTVSFCLLFIYYQFLLLCAVRVIGGVRPRAWRPLFVLATAVTALAYEGWLDLVAFAVVAAAALTYVIWRHGKREWRSGLAFCMATLVIAVLLYLPTKTMLGYGQQAGSESDVVFNYPALAPAVEDVVSKTISNIYIAATNFLPPMLVSSTAFYQLGGSRLAELQHGYHGTFAYLVPMQAMFFWRYAAGAVFVIWCVALVAVLKRLHRAYSLETLTLLMMLLMIGVGGPTHALVKARPMGSMPLLAYHVVVGVLGMSLLISYGVARSRALFAGERRWPMFVAAVWLVLLYSSLARPPLLAHEAAQVGLGEGIYPNPMRQLRTMVGLGYERPNGTTAYRLQPEDRNRIQAQVSALLATLPNPVPPLTEWNREAAVSVIATAEGVRVDGNDSSWGYQLTSPFMTVPPHRQISLRWKGAVQQGFVCLGVLDEQARWLVPADGASPELLFNTGANQRIQIVFANCNAFDAGNPRSTFTVQSVTYGTFEPPSAVHQTQ